MAAVLRPFWLRVPTRVLASHNHFPRLMKYFVRRDKQMTEDEVREHIRQQLYSGPKVVEVNIEAMYTRSSTSAPQRQLTNLPEDKMDSV